MTSQPVACTLTSKDLATQRERWLQLAQHAFLDRVETENGLRLSFRADSSVGDELAQLVDVERECCAWADWLIEQGAGRITVVVSSTGEGVAALHGMFIAAGCRS
jgi:hypothetical protein